MDSNKIEYKRQFKYDEKKNNEMAMDEKLDTSYQSYLGTGYVNDEIYGNRTREDVYANVRETLRSQMEEANRESSVAATRMKDRQERYIQEMNNSLARAREASKSARMARAELLHEEGKRSRERAVEATAQLAQLIQEDEALEVGAAQMDMASYQEELGRKRNLHTHNQQDNEQAEHHSNPFSMFRAMGKWKRRSSLKSKIKDNEERRTVLEREIADKARRWNEERMQYRGTTFRRFYDRYDQTARRYRMVTRTDATELNVEKNIAEYVGVFKVDQLNELLNQVHTNPYMQTAIHGEVKRRLGDHSGNVQDENNRIKYHKLVSMNGTYTNEQGRTKAQRYKLRNFMKNNMEGYAARHSATNDRDDINGVYGGEKVMLRTGSWKKVYRDNLGNALDENTVEENYKNAIKGKMMLDVDRVGWNNDYLYSETNMEILQFKKRWYHRRAYNGFFLDGEFISDNYAEMKGMKDVSGGLLKTGSARWEEEKIAEKLRLEMRTNLAFKQLNSTTIQKYSGYESEDIATKLLDGYKKELDKKLDERWKEGLDVSKLNQDPPDPVEQQRYIQKRLEYQNNLEARKQNFLNPAGPDGQFEPHEMVEFAYNHLKEKLESLGREQRQTLCFDATMIQTHVPYIPLIKETPTALKELSTKLLLEDDPELWKIAKRFMQESLSGDLKVRVEHLPQSGYMMKSGLLDIIQSAHSGWEWALDPTKRLTEKVIPSLAVNLSEVKDRKTTGAYLAGKFLDGTMETIGKNIFGDVSDYMQVGKAGSTKQQAAMKLLKNITGVLAKGVDLGILPGGVNEVVRGINVLKSDELYNDSQSSLNKTHDIIGKSFISIVQIVKTSAKAIKSMTEKERKNRGKTDEVWDSNHPDLLAGLNFGLDLVDALGEIAAFVNQFMPKAVKEMLRPIIGTVTDSIKLLKAVVETTRGYVMKKGIDAAKKTLYENRAGMSVDAYNTTVSAKNNSQIAFVLAHSRREAKKKIVKNLFKVGSTIVSLIGNWIPGKTYTNPVKLGASVTQHVVEVIGVGTEMYMDHASSQSSVENLLGKKEYGKMNKAVFNRVLKRETGIVSKDYLEDLTRILASMDMHYMQKNATAAHDVNAIKVAYAGLFGNVTNESYKNTKLKQLMSVQGLQGNYRNIMKFALHKTANG